MLDAYEVKLNVFDKAKNKKAGNYQFPASLI
jgi:hypothetical protein